MNIKKYLLDGDYIIVNENGSEALVFSDFGKKGLERATTLLQDQIKDKSEIAIYGVLGSVRGIELVIRNVLAFEKITRVFFIGGDIKPFFAFSGIRSLLENGVKDGRIAGFRDMIKEKYGVIPIIDDTRITNDIIGYFKKHIEVIFINSLNDYLKFASSRDRAYSSETNEERKKIARKIREINYNENKSSETLKPKKSPMVGDSIYEETIEEAHKLALLKIMFSGHVVDSQYGKTKEIINLMITVKNPYEEVLSNNQYIDYGKDLVNPRLDSDSYTYGKLICNDNGINQIDAVISRLRNNLYDRANVISLWIPKVHLMQESNQPCLNLIHLLVRNNELNITAYIRSNDIYKAWPLNVAGISYINYHIWKELSDDFPDLRLGMVTTISGSAHIYQHDWNNALKKALTYEKDFVHDKFGYFVISKKGDKRYVAKIYENDGELLGIIEDECPVRLRKKLVRFFSITPEHASYIGEVLGGETSSFMDK